MRKAKSSDSMFNGFNLEFADSTTVKLSGGRKYNTWAIIALVILTLITLLIGVIALIAYIFTRAKKTATISIRQPNVSDEFHKSTIQITSNYKIDDVSKQQLIQYFNSIS